METEFDQYEFENYLTDEFFNGNEKDEIATLIKKRLVDDEEFNEKYEQWMEESGYNSWKDYYQVLQDEEDMAWTSGFPEGDDDDSITDYLTKE
ncbi:MAG: hypothetical protein Q7U47_03530 [Paludibacter sp.]|nr:hypothetical protein [Paludibacter sp.]